MSDLTASENWHNFGELGPCACSQVRRAARKLSLLYDHALAEVGLTVTQYGVLVNVARAGELSRTALAAILGMDRTTLTRNLGPLERSKLIVKAPSEDRRQRLLCLSLEGKRKLRESYSVWERVQTQFLRKIGVETFNELRQALETAEKAAEAILDGRVS
jgi:DNA-binding MarR family transcriptional regulator